MSMRSRIGPEIFSAYRRTTMGVHWHCPPGVAACPHGQGLAVNGRD
jgi:hypothetical protein